GLIGTTKGGWVQGGGRRRAFYTEEITAPRGGKPSWRPLDLRPMLDEYQVIEAGKAPPVWAKAMTRRTCKRRSTFCWLTTHRRSSSPIKLLWPSSAKIC